CRGHSDVRGLGHVHQGQRPVQSRSQRADSRGFLLWRADALVRAGARARGQASLVNSDRRRMIDRIGAAAHEALARGLPSTELWSLLLGVIEQRAQRPVAALRRQWEEDRFVQPAYIDQRALNALEAQLLAAAAHFEAVELSPLAPLGSCSSVAL